MRIFGLILGIMGALSPAAANGLTITATPSIALYGESFSWNVAGLRPGERVTVRASSTDARGIVGRLRSRRCRFGRPSPASARFRKL